MKIRSGFISKLGFLAITSVVVVIGLLYLAIEIRPDARADIDSQNLIRVYCAAGVVNPIRELVDIYNEQNECEVRLVRVGGSGELAGQIKVEFEANVRDQADLFVTNDDLILSDTEFANLFGLQLTVAHQRPVIAVAKECKFKIDTLESLVSQSKIRFGIASERAAIGKLTRTLGERQGVLESLEQEKVLDAENVMVLGQALLSGSLDAAIVWDTTVLQINQANGTDILKVAGNADPNNQTKSATAIGVINSGSSVESKGESLARFLAMSESAKPVFEKHGFHFTAQSTSNMKVESP